MTKTATKSKKTDFKKLFTKAQIVDKDTTANTFTAVASTAAVDRHGEIVSPEGWDLENFKKNPVLLWSHDHTIPAIGKATKVWVEGFGAQAKLMFSGVWQTVTEEGKAAAQLVSDGILNSFSVGFLPYDMEGNTYTEQELLEISLVNVPANPDAMMLAYKSLKDNGFDEEVAKRVTQQFANIGAIRKDLFSTERGAIQDELDEEAMWAAKEEYMRDVWDVFWAFCDVYYSTDTPVDDFSDLIGELTVLLSKIAAGNFAGGSSDNADPSEEQLTLNDGKVVDKPTKSKKIKTNKAKVPVAAAPKAPSNNTLRTKQSVTKAIVKAADQLLAGEKYGNTKQERVDLLKIVKRGGEILSKSNKGDLK
jgi:HK97 family phage prohead protease